MAKIAVIGIAGMSVFMRVDHFHAEGETLHADSLLTEIGGKGINQAVAAARMGAEVCFLAAVGDDAAAAECAATAEQDSICAHWAVKKGKKTPFAYILTDKKGANRVTVYQDAHLSPADVDGFAERIASADILLLQNEVPEQVNARAIAIARSHGVRVIYNPAPPRRISEALARDIFLVTPNEQEAQALPPFAFAHCITTLGGEGCDVDGEVRIPATSARAVDTTGAGDTFNGVLAAAIAEGATLADAARLATCAAGISVTRRGVLTAIPYRNELLEGEKE